jgi:4-amino-4-deoxy-L-arabinose transferase-like glycosyltransferase
LGYPENKKGDNLKFNDKWFIPIFLVLLTLLAAGFRLLFLSRNQLFIDESWTAVLCLAPIWQTNGMDVHPFFGALLIRIPVMIFGMSEFSLRIMPCIFAIIGVPLTYIFAKEVTGKDFPSIIAAILMTISIFQIEQAAMARMYDFLLIFFLLFMIFFMRAYKTNKPIYWYLAAATGILQMITWYYSIIPIGITILWYFLRERKKPLENKPFLYSAIAFIFACTLMVPSFLVAVTLKSTENNNLLFIGPQVLEQALITFFGSPPILAAFMALIAIVGLILLFKDNEMWGGYLGLLCFMSLTIAFFASYKLMMLSRYLYYIQPITCVCIGFFIYSVYKSTKIEWKGAVAALFILLIVIGTFCLALPAYYSTAHNYSGDWYDHSEKFTEIRGDITTVALVGNPAYCFMFKYYLYNNSINVIRFDNLTRLKENINGQNSLVLIPDYAIPTEQPEATVIYNWLQVNGHKKTIYRGFEVYEVNI